jgi:hypothetical protein
MLDARAIKAIPLVLLPSTLGFAQQVQANSAGSAASQNTAFVSCDQHKPKHVLSPVSSSEDHQYHAYVEVDAQAEPG